MSQQPDLGALCTQWWGGSYFNYAFAGVVINALNFRYGQNPPYSVADFLAIYPKFGGVTPTLSGTIAADSDVITAVAGDMTKLLVGQLISAIGVPSGTTIAGVDAGAHTITLSAAATAAGAPVGLTVYVAPLVPLASLAMFVALATSSLAFVRWADQWAPAMALYVAHFADLWCMSEGLPVSTAAQAAQQGIARGIAVAKSAGDVSAGYAPLTGNEDWGAWNLTLYGQQLITLARIVGWGPVYVW